VCIDGLLGLGGFLFLDIARQFKGKGIVLGPFLISSLQMYMIRIAASSHNTQDLLQIWLLHVSTV
jgi:hypothetical protein